MYILLAGVTSTTFDRGGCRASGREGTGADQRAVVTHAPGVFPVIPLVIRPARITGAGEGYPVPPPLGGGTAGAIPIPAVHGGGLAMSFRKTLEGGSRFALDEGEYRVSVRFCPMKLCTKPA